ncbi:MAG: carboxypeptidase-like regulatory domain-containing protein, partial [Chitinophagaceae bacterium]
MRKTLIFLLVFIGLMPSLFSQQSLKDIRKKSYQTFLYRIPADTAEKYLRKGILQIDHYLVQQPVMTFHADSIRYGDIPVGNYLIISVLDSMIETKYYCSTRVLPYVVNNQVKPQLMLRDGKGQLYNNAFVWVNDKPAKFSAVTSTYLITNKNPDEAFIKIAVPGDTSFTELGIERDNYRTVKQQRKERFRATKIGKVVSWLPVRLVRLFNDQKMNRYGKRNKNTYRPEGKGYVMFNKPKYFPSDTIKLKAYLLDKKGKQYKQPVDVFLNYYSRNATINHKLVTLKPVSPGAFVYEFATGDTLPNDTRFTLQFRNKKKEKIILNGQFNIEDYLLDEVASYNINSQKEKYYSGDSLHFTATAKDANGLAVMDGRVKLILLAQKINSFYKERVFVPDTLWQQEKTLVIEGDTKFTIATLDFPDADIELKAVAIFRNSNNEIQQKDIEVDYFANNSKIEIKLENGLVKAVLYKNGIAVEAKGFMETDLTEGPVPVNFPYAGKIDPQTESYEFYTADEKVAEDFDLPSNYSVTFSRIQQMDTVAFALYNPNKIPVYYSLFDKDKEIYSATSSEENIIWKDKIPVGKIYYLRWQYYWAGEQRYGNENIALLSKLMSAEIGGAATVYPGQKDIITIKVRDYKQNEIEKVNLTAVSYNSQFAADIRVPEPPYIQKFRGKQMILHNWYETDEVSVKRSFSLGKHQGWRNQFGLDTMPYYKFLFPEKHFHMVKSKIQELLPQVSVYAVQNGVPQEIYLMYINRQLVYYNGVTDKSVYAVSRFPGYAQFIIRLKDKYIQTDSIYLQPYYKHDIVFDIDKQANNYKVADTVNYWTWQEKDLLNKQILRVENNFRNNNGYVWQDDKAFYLGSSGDHVTGPFINNDSIQFYKPGDPIAIGFDFKFSFEPGYRYRISPQVVRLEKIPIMSFTDKVLLAGKGPRWPLGDTLVDLPVINYERKIVFDPFLEQAGNNYYSTSLGKSRIKLQLPYDSTIAFTVLQSNIIESDYWVLWGRADVLNTIGKGEYTVVLVTKHFNFLTAENIIVDSVGTYCVKFDKPVYENSSNVIALILQRQAERRKFNEEMALRKRKEEEIKNEFYRNPLINLPTGTGVVSGKIIDKKGKYAIPAVAVTIKGYKTGTLAMSDGTYILRAIPAGQYVILFSSVGYYTLEKSITVYEGRITEMSVDMEVSHSALEEVVIIGYGTTTHKKSLSYSVSSIRSENLTQALMGKVAGISIDGNSGAATEIRIRGANSISGNSELLIIIDGVPVDKMPEGLEIANMSVLKDAAATALYGSRAANGAIIITSKGFAPKMLREEFRDYAFWKPNLITDEKGEVKFEVTYPHNITSWQTYVLGMDKKHRITKATKVVKAFKPMLAQLSAPQFLVEGDTAVAIGKKINYTAEPLKVDAAFTLNGKQQNSITETLKGNDATISELIIVAAPGTDTLTARFSMKADNGFADGEQRKIPVLKKGTMETIGQFNILEGDTSITVKVKENAGNVKVYAQNNTFDLFLDEIEHLKEYPYYCMEQTASKLTGYVMEKKIKEALKQSFANENEMNKLLSKIQKGQLFDGSWGWWEGSLANFSITNYITRALLQLRGDALLESNIRNALLFLSNQLPKMDKFDLLESLYTLNEAGHDMDYTGFLKRLVFDSLTQHQQ